MNKKRGLFLLSILFLFFIIYYLFQDRNLTKENKMGQIYQPLELHFWEEGREDFLKYAYGNIDAHPVGLNFIDIHWKAPQLGAVKIITEFSDFIIPNVLKVGGVDYARMKRGIQDITVRGSLHYDEYTMPEMAYEAYVALMEQINQKKWQQYFSFSSPRIHPDDNLLYTLNEGRVIDPTYILSYNEWEDVLDKNSGLILNLSNHEISLNISIRRRYQDDEKAQYSVRYTFRTFRYLIQNGIKKTGMDQEEYKKAFNDFKAQYEQFRAKAEQNMIEKGYKINESYTDPDYWQYAK